MNLVDLIMIVINIISIILLVLVVREYRKLIEVIEAEKQVILLKIQMIHTDGIMQNYTNRRQSK